MKSRIVAMPSVSGRYRCRVPMASRCTRPASASTFRCCDTAGRLTGSRSATSATESGERAISVNTCKRVGSPSAAKRRA